MKFRSILLALGFGLAATASANASVLFSDDFQTALSSTNWATIGSAQIVTAPAPAGGNALSFATTGAGGVLFSNIIAGTGAGDYSLQFQYYSPTAGGGGAYIGLIPTNTTTTNPDSGSFDDWVATDSTPITPYPVLTTFSSGADGWTDITINFTVASSAAFGLKLEDFNGSSPYLAGDTFMRNLTLSSAVPEPATWAMFLLGFGVIGFVLRRKALGILVPFS